jgi:gluconokinase
MTTYPKSPKEMVAGMMWFPRMLDKIRLHSRGDLHSDYHPNLGRAAAMDGRCLNLLRVKFEDLRKRVEQGGTDEEILEWCYQTGRRPNKGDLEIWNGFVLKFGWKDQASPFLEKRKTEFGLVNRPDIETFVQLIEFDEGRSGAR